MESQCLCIVKHVHICETEVAASVSDKIMVCWDVMLMDPSVSNLNMEIASVFKILNPDFMVSYPRRQVLWILLLHRPSFNILTLCLPELRAYCEIQHQIRI